MLVTVKKFMYEFAEESPNPAGGQDQKLSDEMKNTESKDGQDKNPAEHMIPKSRFDEVNQKFKDLQAKLDEFTSEKAKADAERQKAEKKAKEEQGKYEELYKTTSDELGKFKDEHKNASQRVIQLETVINAMLETRLANVPEDFRDLVPANLNPEAKLEWLTAAESKGLFNAANQKKSQPVGESTNRFINDTERMKFRADSFGNGGVNIGSHRVVTINFPRIALESRTIDDFYRILDKRARMVRDLLLVHREEILRRRVKRGFRQIHY